jgi:signal transduction histidine kinase
VHRLVTQLGGDIEVTSGPGATFTATLPVASAQASQDQPAVSRQAP